jgi:hypothetical protein
MAMKEGLGAGLVGVPMTAVILAAALAARAMERVRPRLELIGGRLRSRHRSLFPISQDVAAADIQYLVSSYSATPKAKGSQLGLVRRDGVPVVLWSTMRRPDDVVCAEQLVRRRLGM